MSDRDKKEFSKAYRKLRKEVNELEKIYKKARKKHKKNCDKYDIQLQDLEKAIVRVEKKKKKCKRAYTKHKKAFLKARQKLDGMLKKTSEKIKQQSKPKMAPTIPTPAPAPAASVTKKTSNLDRLRKVHGIGPKIEQLLYDAGIHTFADLAQSKVDHLRAILKEAGSRYTMHNPEAWPRLAKEM